MNLAINATEPSLHDWKREEWERQEMKKDMEEKRFHEEYKTWEMYLYLDKNKDAAKEEIQDIMDDVMMMIADDQNENKQFNWLLFCAYCSGDYSTALNKIIESYLMRSYKKGAGQ